MGTEKFNYYRSIQQLDTLQIVKKNACFLHRLINSLSGIKVAFKSESSFKAQCVIAVIVLAVAVSLKLSGIWLALLVVIILEVLAFELMNTAIEYLCDLVNPGYSEKVKLIKDIAAGAVLLVSIASVLVVLIKIIQ